MSYAATEAAVEAGSPFFLYELAKGETVTRLTSRAQAYTASGETWTPSPIAHGRISQSGRAERTRLPLTLPLSDPFAVSFLSPLDARTTTVTILRRFEELPAANDQAVLFKGQVTAARVTGETVEITCEPVFSTVRKLGMGDLFQSPCRHSVYGPGCNLALASRQDPGTATGRVGKTYTVTGADARPDGEYTFGVLAFGDDLTTILNHTGTALTVVRRLPGLDAALNANQTPAVLIARGCNRTFARCQELGNPNNFGGFPERPARNAMDGQTSVTRI